MRVLLDTNVLARSSAGFPALAHEVLLEVTKPEHALILSPFLVQELSRVLRYERVRPIHGFSDEEINQFVSDLILVAEMVIPSMSPTIIESDPQDDPILAAAVTGKAEILCTRDRHFLEPKVVEYCEAHGISIKSDETLLMELRRVR